MDTREKAYSETSALLFFFFLFHRQLNIVLSVPSVMTVLASWSPPRLYEGPFIIGDPMTISRCDPGRGFDGRPTRGSDCLCPGEATPPTPPL